MRVVPFACAVLALGLMASCGSRIRAAYGRPDYPPPRAAPSAAPPSRSSTSVSTSGSVAMTSDETALSMTIERDRSDAGDYYLHGGFAFAGWEVRLVALPARYPEHVGVTVRNVDPAHTATYRGCAVRVMANGIMLEDLTHEDYDVEGDTVTGYRETIRVIAPRSELALMAGSDRLAIRICDAEVRLGPEHRAVLAEILLRVEEELRWLADDANTAAAAGSPVQDLTATPAP